MLYCLSPTTQTGRRLMGKGKQMHITRQTSTRLCHPKLNTKGKCARGMKLSMSTCQHVNLPPWYFDTHKFQDHCHTLESKVIYVSSINLCGHPCTMDLKNWLLNAIVKIITF